MKKEKTIEVEYMDYTTSDGKDVAKDVYDCVYECLCGWHSKTVENINKSEDIKRVTENFIKHNTLDDISTYLAIQTGNQLIELLLKK